MEGFEDVEDTDGGMGATVKEANEERTEREKRIPEMTPDGISGNEVDSLFNGTITEFDRYPAKLFANSDEKPAVAEDTVFNSVLEIICVL